jgi:lipid II isoglutaminyl synthase (glutamine-hydrolysing)
VNTNILEQLLLIIAVTAAKSITSLVRLFRLGAASVLPGTIAGKIQPNLLSLLSEQVKYGVILIVGTNGKTTTSLLLRTILENERWKVIHNAEGANLVNGLMTTLLKHTNFLGQLKGDYAILEVDENVLPIILPKIKPQYILCLNLFRDQLDRYGEVDTISHRWGEAIAKFAPHTTIIINGDDPTLAYLGEQLTQKVLAFGLSEPELYLEEIPHAVDAIYCPKCGHSLDYEGVYISHQGDFSCPSCGFKKGELAIKSQDWEQVLIGVYNKYNTLAAVLTAQQLEVQETVIRDTIKNFHAAFGRAEMLDISGKKVRILLSKNPVALNETIRAVNQLRTKENNSIILMVLNDRTPDGTDVSWIWDVDTEKLVEKSGIIVVSGDRVYDIALRIRYSQDYDDKNCQLIVEEHLQSAIDKALELTPVGETLHILPTYSAMLEVRGILTGKQIL